jgi:hypothetical protein
MMGVHTTTIIDPSGTAWLLDGSQGIWEMNGRKGFHGATYVHYRDDSPAVNGAFWRGVRTTVRELFIPIFIMDPSGANNRDVVLAARRSLAAAIAPGRGECTIISAWPDGSVRQINARYVDGFDAGEQGPGEYGITKIKYGLRFIADDPYFAGEEVFSSWALASSGRLELPMPGADTLFEVVTAPLLTSSAPVSTLNTNSGFESGTSNWAGLGGTFSIDTGTFTEGTQSGKIVPDGVTANAQMASDQVAVVGGQAYVAQGWLRCATARLIDLNVNWFDAAHAFLSASLGPVTVAASTWTFTSHTFTAPPAAAYASILPTVPLTPPAADVLWADDIVLGLAMGNTIVNEGDSDAYPVWTFGGPFSSVTLQNLTTGQTLTLNYTASITDHLVLTTKPGETSLVDQNGINRWSSLQAGYQLWPLAQGVNSVNVGMVGPTIDSSVTLSYTPLYEGD